MHKQMNDINLMLATLDCLNAAVKKWKTFQDENSLTEINNYYDKLFTLKQKSTEVTQALLDNLPIIVEAHSKYAQYFSVTRSRDVLKLLIDQNKLNDLINIKDGEVALAWFCCDHSCLYLDDGKPGRDCKPLFKELLRTWTNQSIAENANPDLKFVMSLLYGETCWQLYGIEASQEESSDQIWKMISEVTQLNLPFAFKKESYLNLENAMVEPPDSII